MTVLENSKQLSLNLEAMIYPWTLLKADSRFSKYKWEDASIRDAHVLSKYNYTPNGLLRPINSVL
jgi:hypothetical protein